MSSISHKKISKKYFLLLVIILFHVIPIFISAYHDRTIHEEHFSHGRVKLNELRYWLWFFTWWSAWASLITIPWAIYKIFFSQSKKSSYSEQLIDLIITEVNLVSGIVFCLGGFLFAKPNRPTAPYPLLGETKTIYVWLFYNLFWHVLAPGLVFYYFWKYCQVDKLVKNKQLTFFANLFNPTLYLFYVLIRPEIKIINYYDKLRGSQSYNYPSNYPYAPFFWIMGEVSGKKEHEKLNISKWFFWHSWSPWLKSLFWFSIIISLTYLLFSLLSNFLIKINTKQKSELWKKSSFSQLFSTIK